MRQKLISLCLVAAAALLTGTMMVLALPLGEQAYLAWFMMVPLLAATKEKGFLLGFLGGLGAVFWCGWLSTTGAFYAHRNFAAASYWTYTGCGLFASTFALVFAIWGDQKNHLKSIWWYAALAVALESILLLKLPAPLAITQYRNPIMMVVASGIGIWGVSYLAWLANLAFVRSRIGQVAICALAVFSYAMTRMQRVGSEPETVTVAASQFMDGSEKELTSAHEKLGLSGVAFDVWPEFAGMMFVRGSDTSKLKEVSKEGSPVITSFRDTANPLPHNVAAIFANGGESVHYEKRKLFGSETTMHAPGNHAVAVPLDQMHVGLNICYDSCFPYIIRETAALSDVKIVALPTIDPDSLHYFIAGMHASFTPFRSAENGVALIRADGNYGSMITDPHGHIVAELFDQQKTLVGKVSSKRVWTLYQVIGDSFWYLCILATFAYPISWKLKAAKARRDRALESAKDGPK